jgi:hypothetical protein
MLTGDVVVMHRTPFLAACARSWEGAPRLTSDSDFDWMRAVTRWEPCCVPSPVSGARCRFSGGSRPQFL